MTRRTYDQFCPLASTLDLVGERWTLLIARDLIAGPKRYTDLRDGLPGIATDLLGRRLRDLEAAGIVRRRELPPPAASVVYELTERGAELEPALLALARFGLAERGEVPSGGEGLAPGRLDLFRRVLFDPEAARNVSESYALRANGVEVGVLVDHGRLQVLQDAADLPTAPAVTITGDGPAMLEILTGRRGLEDALTAGLVELNGDGEAAARFVACFPAARDAAVAV